MFYYFEFLLSDKIKNHNISSADFGDYAEKAPIPVIIFQFAQMESAPIGD
jgi:hypothetical protein